MPVPFGKKRDAKDAKRYRELKKKQVPISQADWEKRNNVHNFAKVNGKKFCLVHKSYNC